MNSAASLHQQSIVIDAVCPLVMDDPQHIDLYRQGGATVIAPTVGGWEGPAETLKRLAKWCRNLRERDDLMRVRSADDVMLAKSTNRLGIYFHLQGSEPVGANLDLVDLYKVLGVGMIQLTYNVRNRVGDGCEEPSDAGLSRFGAALVRRLNEARIIVDCSHTGNRTSMDAIARSTAPVVLSHSNVGSIHNSARNVSDELMKAIAESGGVIGIAGFPAMLSPSTAPTLAQFVEHIDAVVQRCGIDHVALGIDYYPGQSGIASDESAFRTYQDSVQAGWWGDAYPPPPHNYPHEIRTPVELPALTEDLLQRGYSDDDVLKILGANWLRVMRQIWN